MAAWFLGESGGFGSSGGNAVVDVVDEAKELADRGDLLGAIDLLTKANRRGREVRVEELLLELRYQAYVQGTRPSEPPFQPDAVADLFPGAVIPEIDAAALTVDAVRSAILCHGSLIVRGLLKPDRVSSLGRRHRRGLRRLRPFSRDRQGR